MLPERLRKLRNKKGNTQQEIAEYLGITRPAYTAYEKGTRQPGYETINRLAIYFDTTIDYLLGFSDIENIHKYLTIMADKMGVTIRELSNNIQDIIISLEKSTVPIIKDITASLPLLHKENYIGEVEIPHSLVADFALIASNGRMAWIGIFKGDTLIFKETKTPPDGAIIATMDNRSGTVTINYYSVENGKKILHSANPLQKNIVIGKHHQIIGEAVKIIKDPPPYQTYLSMMQLGKKTEKQWQDVFHKASGAGLSGEKVIKLIEVFLDINQKTESPLK